MTNCNNSEFLNSVPLSLMIQKSGSGKVMEYWTAKTAFAFIRVKIRSYIKTVFKILILVWWAIFRKTFKNAKFIFFIKNCHTERQGNWNFKLKCSNENKSEEP